MADQTIGTLENLSDIADDALLVVEYNGKAYNLTGAQWKSYAIAAAQSVQKGDKGDPGEKGDPGDKGDPGVGIRSIQQVQGGQQSGQANVLRITMEDGQASQFTVYNGQSGARVIQVVTQESSADGGVNIITFRDDEGNLGTARVRNGTTGRAGVSPTVTVTAIAGGHRVTITDASGSQSFDVLDGEDGDGAGDMLASAYDPELTVKTAGGIAAYVQTQIGDALEGSY